MSVLSVSDLSVDFKSSAGAVRAVENLSFSVAAGETLAIVGESGCGKSATALALMRLLPKSAALRGSVRLEGKELSDLPERAMRGIRGNRLAMIFQDPMAALDPVMTVGDQIVEAVRAHESLSRHSARQRAKELLDLVHIPGATRRLDEYPHRLSGGMRQRIAIAMAVATKPSVLIADEPTTALDVTIQAQILALLHSIQRELGMALILITHDLGVVAEMAERVLVMYAGRKVEEQTARGLFRRPRHPYTQRLIAAKPRLSADGARNRLQEIPGIVPRRTAASKGCVFASRCVLADAHCAAEMPELVALDAQTYAACFKSDAMARAA